MSLLSQIFGQAESGNNPNQGLQSTGTIGGQFQQSLGFQQQYGGNTTGATILDPAYQEAAFNNYASAAIAANPSITLGDLYSGYYGGTGNPASVPGFSSLPGNVQANIANSAAMYGADTNTPAADLFGSNTQVASEPDFSSGFDPSTEFDNVGLTSTPAINSLGTSLIPGNAPGLAGLPQGGETFVGQIPSTPVSAMLPSGIAANIGLAPGVITAANQWFTSLGKSVVQGFDSAVEGMLGPVSNYVTRGFIILIAIALIVVAGWGLMRGGAHKALKAATTV